MNQKFENSGLPLEEEEEKPYITFKQQVLTNR
jgi:hypothetical protein